jgi:hypothetical protein
MMETYTEKTMVEYAVNGDLTYTVWYDNKIIGKIDPLGDNVRQTYIYENGNFILKHTFLFPEEAYAFFCNLVGLCQEGE